MCNFMQSLLVTVTVFMSLASGTVAQSSCQTNADTTAMHIRMVKQIVTWTDSATLVSQGIPYKPTGAITLVSDSQTCTKAVTAINATLTTSDPRRVTKAYVIKIGTKNYAAIGEKTPSVYTMFDSKFKRLAGLVAMN